MNEEKALERVIPTQVGLDSFLQAYEQIGPPADRRTFYPLSFYYYFINDELMAEKPVNKILIPPTNSVFIALYAPYLKAEDLYLRRVQYDVKRFPVEGLSDDIEWSAENSQLLRIIGQRPTYIEKKVGEFTPYNVEGKDIGPGKPRNWRNEGKLWQFPFHYSLLFDGMCEPLEIRPHVCYDKTKAEVMVRTPVGPSGQYQLYVTRYKEDLKGIFMGKTCTSSLQLPLISSTYTDYMSRSKAQLAAGRVSSGVQGVFGIAGAGVSGASAYSMHTSNALNAQRAASSMQMAAVNSAFQTGMSSAATQTAGAAAQAATIGAATAATGGTALLAGAAVAIGAKAISSMLDIHKSLAFEQDLMESPGNLNSLGADLTFDLINSSVAGRNSLCLYRIKSKEYIMEKIGDFFAMYGYAQNKVMSINLRNRYHYNYIKTTSSNITCKDGIGIPKAHFNALKGILNNGVTVWHIDRPGVHVGDYSKDNTEV